MCVAANAPGQGAAWPSLSTNGAASLSSRLNTWLGNLGMIGDLDLPQPRRAGACRVPLHATAGRSPRERHDQRRRALHAGKRGRVPPPGWTHLAGHDQRRRLEFEPCRIIPTARAPGRQRIAVVGDCYVHGAFVDVGDGFPEVMQRESARFAVATSRCSASAWTAPRSANTCTCSGARSSLYSPDIVVVPLIHNDFDESYRLLKTRYASRFMKLRKAADGSVEEVAPGEFRYGIADALRGFRTFRYLYYETNLYLHVKGWVSRLFWGGNEEWRPELVSSAVDIRKIADHEANRFFARYVMAEMKRLSTGARVQAGVRDGWGARGGLLGQSRDRLRGRQAQPASPPILRASSTCRSSICKRRLRAPSPRPARSSSMPTTGIGTLMPTGSSPARRLDCWRPIRGSPFQPAARRPMRERRGADLKRRFGSCGSSGCDHPQRELRVATALAAP